MGEARRLMAAYVVSAGDPRRGARRATQSVILLPSAPPSPNATRSCVGYRAWTPMRMHAVEIPPVRLGL
eukprot:3804985-Pyramimonas_sp.AAC.2